MHDILLYTAAIGFLVSVFVIRRQYATWAFGIVFVVAAHTLILERMVETSVSTGVAFLAGMALSIPLFVASLLLTKGNIAEELRTIAKTFPRTRNFVRVSAGQIFTAFPEELIWRVGLQALAISVFGWMGGIFVVAGLFTLAHTHQIQNAVPRGIDVFLHSLLLGLLFEWTGSFLLVGTLHAARNILVILYRLSEEKLQDERIKSRVLGITLVVVILAMGTGGFAQDAKDRTMTLSEVVSQAKVSNRDILAKEQEVEAAKFRYFEAVRAWLPNVALEIDTNYYKRDNFQSGTEGQIEIAPGISLPGNLLSSTGQEYYSSSFGLGLTQIILDDGRVRGGVARSAAEYKLKKLELENERRVVARRAAEAFYGYLISKERVAVLHFEKEVLARARNAAIETFYIRELGSIEREIALTEGEQDLYREKGLQGEKKGELLELMGYGEGGADVKFVADDLDNSLAGISRSPDGVQFGMLDLEIAKTRMEVLRGESLVSASGNKPKMEFYSNYRYFKTNPELRGSVSELDRAWVGGIRMVWSFFDQGKTSARVAASDAHLEESGIEIASLEEKLRAESDSIKATMEYQKKLRDLLMRKRELLGKRMSVATRSRDAGMVANEVVLNRKADMARVGVKLLEVERDLFVGNLRLYELNGRGKDYATIY